MSFARWVRQVASASLDLSFEGRSPIPVAPTLLLERIGRYWVKLPPSTFFEPGNQHPVGMAYLVRLARALGAKSIFEIGTYNGVTALTLAENLPEATVHTLDLPPGSRPTLPVNESDQHNLSHLSRGSLGGGPATRRVVQHLGDSASFDFEPFNKTCQLVYVDGAHSKEYVANDTKVAYKLVADPGAIVWDDYWRRVPDVPAFLNSMNQSHLYRLPGSRLVVWLSAQAASHLSQAERSGLMATQAPPDPVNLKTVPPNRSDLGGHPSSKPRTRT